MYQLLCDKCGVAINPGKKTMHLELEESVYKGNTHFLQEPGCMQKNSIVLCDYCARCLRQEVLNTNRDRLDF